MYLSKLARHFIFSNYTDSFHQKTPPDKLIARRLIPKKIADWGRSLHDRKITTRYSSSSTKITKKLVTANKKKIKKFFSSDIKDYINSTSGHKTLFDDISSEDKIVFKEHIKRCANFMAAYPNYMTMTSEKLKKAFLSLPHNPVKILNECDLREATNFALRRFLEVRNGVCLVPYQGDHTLDEVCVNKLLKKYGRLVIVRYSKDDKRHSIPCNRIFITQRNGNEHLKKVKYDDNSPTSSHYSFDLLAAETREKLLSTIGALLSEPKKKK